MLFRFFGPRRMLPALALLLGLQPSAHANISVDDTARYRLTNNQNPWFLDNHVSATEQVARMGMATFERKQFFAVRDGDGGIRVTQDIPGAALAPDPSDRVTIVIPKTDSTLHVAGLLPFDGFLYLVYFTQNGTHFYVQKFKSTGNSGMPLVKVGEPIDTEYKGGVVLRNVMPVIGDSGLYVHTLATYGSQNMFLDSYVMRGGNMEFITEFGQPPTYLPHQRGLADAVSTHEIAADGTPVEVQYLTWIGNRSEVICRFTPSLAQTSTLAYDLQTYLDPYFDVQIGATLTVAETGLNGDDMHDYGLSLLLFSREANGTFKAQVKSISTTTHQLASSGWIPVSFPFESNNGQRYGTNVGVDKGIVRNTSPATKRNSPDHGFVNSLQMCVRGAVISINFDETGDWFCRSGLIRGNRLASPAASIKTLDTADAQKASTPEERNGQLAAWTLLGVMHGVPPYPTFDKKLPGSFPTVSYNTSVTSTETAQMSITSEDAYEVTIGASVGGLPKEGFGWGIEGTYGYATKTTLSTTTSNTRTLNTSVNYKTVASGFAGQTNPASVGSLLFSAPEFCSKTYNVQRWDQTAFNGPARQIFLTQVTGRTLRFLHYILGAPELGPLETMPEAGDPTGVNKLIPLTQGIRPEPRIDDFKAWRDGPEKDVDYSQVYDEFDPTRQQGGSAVSIDESKGTESNFAFSYSSQDSSSQSTALVKSHKETVKVTLGVTGLFVGTVSGAATQTSSLTNTQTSTLTLAQAISGAVPVLPPNQPITSVVVRPLLIFAKDGPNQRPPVWVPTLLSGSSSPFLLTWKVNSVVPERYGSQPFRQPHYNAPYPN